MKASCVATNDALGKYIVAPSSLENIISIPELLSQGYYFSGTATHLYIHPPSVLSVSFNNVESKDVSIAFMKHSDGIYRVSKTDLDIALHLN